MLNDMLNVGIGEDVGYGIEDAAWGAVEAVVKVMDSTSVIGEYLAAAFGQFVGLPVVPGVIASIPQGTAWLSLKVGTQTGALPFCRPSALRYAFPDLAAGVGVFDAFLSNADRHEGNMSILDGKPLLFDHAFAFSNYNGSPGKVWTSHLHNMVTNENAAYVKRWVQAFAKIPQSFVRAQFAYLRSVPGLYVPPRLERFVLDRLREFPKSNVLEPYMQMRSPRRSMKRKPAPAIVLPAAPAASASSLNPGWGLNSNGVAWTCGAVPCTPCGPARRHNAALAGASPQ